MLDVLSGVTWWVAKLVLILVAVDLYLRSQGKEP